MQMSNPEWLRARADLVAILINEGILDSRDGIAGFWRGEDWVSIYDLMEETND
jgi:hypothetical protein